MDCSSGSQRERPQLSQRVNCTLLNDGVDEVAPEDRIVKDPCSNNGRDSVELITPDDSASISRTDCLAVGEILLRVRRNLLN
jgi:hypothetical protein